MQHIRIKYCAIIVLTFLTFFKVSGQDNVGIGTSTPHASAMLQVSDSSRGVLIPRTDTMAVLNYVSSLTPNPGIANGLLIFDTLINAYLYYEEISGQWQNMLNLVGPRGARGNQGARGPRGDTGMINDWRDSLGFDQKVLRKDTCNDWFFDASTGRIWKMWCDTLGGNKTRKWVDTVLWDKPIGNLTPPSERIEVYTVYANTAVTQTVANSSSIVDMINIPGTTVNVKVEPDEVAYIWFAAHGTTSKAIPGDDMSYAQYEIVVGSQDYYRSGDMQHIVTLSPNGPGTTKFADRVGWYLSGQHTLVGDLTDPIDCRCGTPYQKPSCACAYGIRSVNISLMAGNRYSGSSTSSLLFLADRITSENPTILNVFVIIRRNPKALPRKR